MISKSFWFTALVCGVFSMTSTNAQQSQPLVVKVDQPGAAIQSTMWGLFFEDINFAADGGLYAEMVKNRSFEFFHPLTGWTELKTAGEAGSCLIVKREKTDPQNPRFAHITVDAGKGTYGLSNDGFRGMGVKKEMTYHFSVMARQNEGSAVTIRVELVDSKGAVIGNASLAPTGSEWKKYSVSFTANKTEPKAKLNVWFADKGSVDIDMFSLFPNDTWKNRSNGLRADLVQLLADMKPGFLRFPGGCIVEGRELSTRYQWKTTVGDVNDRKAIVSRWNTEFSHRLTPDYFQSFGLGFFEYFQLSEDIGAEPLPILNCGMACQFNTSEVAAMNELDPYIQDALDLIEFANGTPDTRWGGVRAGMGHPAAFNLKFLGIGNEQWGPQYIERYKVFVKAIKDKYPAMVLVTGTGPYPDGEFFDFASRELKPLHAEIVDEHYYRSPEWFLQNATRYDQYDRKSFKIFAGEYAAQTVAIASPNNKNSWYCAMAEAAFMTGLERNADVVYLSSYAPLFAHVDAWQWTPDLIWFDNLRACGSANYYVQKLFSIHKGTQVLPVTSMGKALVGQDKLYASAVFDAHTRDIIVKLVNASDQARTTDVVMETSKKISPNGRLTILQNTDLKALNTLDNPATISPRELTVDCKSKKLSIRMEPYSFYVMRLGVL